MENIKKVALYIRVSTDRQAKEGESLEAQENALIEYCKKNNLFIYDKYIDGGESGQKLKRTNLQRMLNDVKNDKIDLILMTKLDRWFRNVADFYKVIELIKAHKVGWKTIWEDYDTTTAYGEFWLNMSLSMAQLEAKRTGERIKSVFDYKYNVLKTVCSGKPPFGYSIDENKKYVINEKEAQIVRELFNKYIETNSLNKTYQWYKATYGPISYCQIKRRLKKRCYIGEFEKTNKEIAYDFIPPILDKDTFDKVQQLFNTNIKNYQYRFEADNEKVCIFSGLVYCNTCHRKMRGKNNSAKVRYYECPYHYKKDCTNRTNLKETKLEEYLLNQIENILKNRKIDIIKINSKEKKVIDNTDELNIKRNRLTSLYVDNLIDYNYYEQEFKRISNEILEIEKQKQEIKEKIDYTYIDNFLKMDFKNIYYQLNNVERHKLWQSIIKDITIEDKDNLYINVY